MIQKEFYSSFKSMGTEVAAVIVHFVEAAVEREFETIKNEAENFEKRFSRFLPNSELSRLNNSAGTVFLASSEMIEILLLAKKAHEITNGIFDPIVISALETVGYDKDFDSIEKENKKDYDREKLKTIWAKQAKFNNILINKKEGIVNLPQDARLDLGGIAKGFFVDAIAKRLEKKYENFWISAGGDMYLKGRDKDGKNWKIGVQNPLQHDEDITSLESDVSGTAAATSGITKRKGGEGKLFWHHLINPRTGLPAATDILAATVLADSVWLSDVLAKTAVILGKEEAPDLLKNFSAKYILIDKNMKITRSENLKKYAV